MMKLRRAWHLFLCRWLGCKPKWDGNELFLRNDAKPGRLILDRYVCKRCGLRWRECEHLHFINKRQS